MVTHGVMPALNTALHIKTFHLFGEAAVDKNFNKALSMDY
jgi:hypothetical protein